MTSMELSPAITAASLTGSNAEKWHARETCDAATVAGTVKLGLLPGQLLLLLLLDVPFVQWLAKLLDNEALSHLCTTSHDY